LYKSDYFHEDKEENESECFLLNTEYKRQQLCRPYFM